jgi:hypothetical protein
MAGKYVFTGQLREMRFLFCQKSEHSSATRYCLIHWTPEQARYSYSDAVKVVPHESLPHHEEEQPTYTNSVARGFGYRAPGIRTIRYGNSRQVILTTQC